jgi:molybdenum cofactor synthesis domain-containing protein
MKEISKTAGIIIIGNEILSGKVQDINSFYLTSELRALGITVTRISIIQDEVDTIGNEAVSFSADYDYVFSTGGVGPTHDDVTMAGIADGFGVGLVHHPDIKEALSGRYKYPLNSPLLKMTEVPEGAEAIFGDTMVFPIVRFRNIFIFPGIPAHLKQKFPYIRDRFRAGTFYIKRIFMNTDESEIAEILNSVVSHNNDVMIGSYPITGETGFSVLITVESRSENILKDAFEELIRSLPVDNIVRTE